MPRHRLHPLSRRPTVVASVSRGISYRCAATSTASPEPHADSSHKRISWDKSSLPWAGCCDAIAAAVVAGGDDNDDDRWSFRNVGRDGKEETTSLVVNVDVDEDDDDGGIVEQMGGGAIG